MAKHELDRTTLWFLKAWCVCIVAAIGGCIYMSHLEVVEARAKAEEIKRDCEDQGGIMYNPRNCGKWRRAPCSVHLSICLLPVSK